MRIVKFIFNPIQENTYIVFDEQKNAVIIDPGCYFQEERDLLRNYISENQLNICAILNTHAHLDHVMGNAFMKREFGVDLYLHQADLPTLAMGEKSAQLYGMYQFEPSPLPDKYLEDKQKLQFGDMEFEVIFGPGHSPGHVAFYSSKDKLVINGDILFKGSYGRVDLPGGNFDVLKHTITQRMFLLPDDTVVYSGHGTETTIGDERMSNPILW
ncbi:MAG: MBL fold metallo-hydrolase [Brumimicrobium sp.]|nr:MBL fold metallo-hydrolase [Brumimicrobium sp.]MCO5269770.1 MBL fold metallo-hydrolase [Brumimicrobium sp.]